MFLKRSPRQAIRGTSDRGERESGPRVSLRMPSAPDRVRLAHAFYGDALGGRQVWDAERSSDSASLCFIVSGQRVDVSTTHPVDHTRLILSVGNPHRFAERVWDAGFSVRVDNSGAGAPTVSVIDPFGRRIDLVP